ncbi:MAG TPA: hypothetical protein VFN84_09605, partial [Pseudolabrys sp.]|nr:hypothetical protein [Pseudolabrys sp.]
MEYLGLLNLWIEDRPNAKKWWALAIREAQPENHAACDCRAIRLRTPSMLFCMRVPPRLSQLPWRGSLQTLSQSGFDQQSVESARFSTTLASIKKATTAHKDILLFE